MKVSDLRSHARSTLSVTAMGLGCAQMGNLYRMTPYAESLGAFEAAWDAGIRYFDTAPFYGFSRSELRLGTMLGEHPRASYHVSTKVGRPRSRRRRREALSGRAMWSRSSPICPAGPVRPAARA